MLRSFQFWIFVSVLRVYEMAQPVNSLAPELRGGRGEPTLQSYTLPSAPAITCTHPHTCKTTNIVILHFLSVSLRWWWRLVPETRAWNPERVKVKRQASSIYIANCRPFWALFWKGTISKPEKLSTWDIWLMRIIPGLRKLRLENHYRL